MKRYFTGTIIALFSVCASLTCVGADAPAPATDTKEVRAVVDSINAKLKQGKDKESDFAAELKQFDDLIKRLKTAGSSAAAEAAYMRAFLYVQVFEDAEKGSTLMKGVQKDYPNTTFATKASDIVASLERQAQAKKVADALVPGSKFPDFSETDLAGKPLSVANYKGKVVLVDFWATWCPPCRAELPNVIETYDKYHSKGFEIIGVSLDQEKPKLEDFIKSNKMGWPQYFDGKGWQNKVAQSYGISSIPATFLLDGDGKIIARDLRGADLAKAVDKAVSKN